MLKTKNRMNVEELRKSGYKVKVYHARKFKGWWDLMSKKEFIAGWPNHTIGLHIDSYGGFTKVEVTCPEGFTSVGKFNTPTGEQFNRKLGLTAALGRALKAHDEQA